MGFFENIFGFEESNYCSTQKGILDRATFSYAPPNPTREYWQEHCSFQVPNGDKGTRHISAGTFSMPSVEQLRSRVRHEMALLSKQGSTASSPAEAESPKRKKTTIEASQRSVSTITVRNMVGEARSLHSEPFAALLGKTSKYPPGDFPSENYYVVQAASQFNLLEFPSPRTTPEAGIDG